mgnify:CR=1 FL=1
MAKGKFRSMSAAAAAGALAFVLSAGPVEAGKPNIMESCKICHQAADGVIRPDYSTLSVGDPNPGGAYHGLAGNASPPGGGIWVVQ